MSVAVATDSESGSMKHSAARLATTWWPPITVVPRRAASSVMAVNDVASSAYDRLMGTPRCRISRSAGQRGPVQWIAKR